MKKFKNALTTVVAGLLVLSMAGCGGSAANSGAETETGTVAEAGSSEDTSAPLNTGTEGKLVWATNAEFPPYEYHAADGSVAGIDAEIANYIGEQLGLEVQCEDMQFDSIIPAVTSGKADLGIAGMTVTEDRLVNVNFTTPYISAGQVIIVTEDSPIAGVADLAGKTIGVQLGTTGDSYVSDPANVEGATVERYNKGFEAVQALTQGKIDAVVIDNEPAKSFVESGEGIKILDEPVTEEEYAIAVSKDNEALLEAVNGVLSDMAENGKLEEIISKYIGDNAVEIEEADTDATNAESEAEPVEADAETTTAA